MMLFCVHVYHALHHKSPHIYHVLPPQIRTTPRKNASKGPLFSPVNHARKKRQFATQNPRPQAVASATPFGSIQSLPTMIRTTSMTAHSAKTCRTPMYWVRRPDRINPEICAVKMIDINVEPTRPSSSGGVAC